MAAHVGSRRSVAKGDGAPIAVRRRGARTQPCSGCVWGAGVEHYGRLPRRPREASPHSRAEANWRRWPESPLLALYMHTPFCRLVCASREQGPVLSLARGPKQRAPDGPRWAAG